MNNKPLKKLKKLIINENLDGYIVPKNDNFFTEQVKYDRLKLLTNFSGSAGLAIILKKKNFLYVDSRYTIQAKFESGKFFKIVKIHEKLPRNQFKNIYLGYDPSLFTYNQLSYYFGNKLKLKAIKTNLVDEVIKKKRINYKPFYSLSNSATGLGHKKKISLLSKYVKDKKADFIFITAPENVAWLLNIRGSDTPYSPIPNCNLVLSKDKKLYLIADKNKTKKIVFEKKLNSDQIIEKNDFENFVKNLNGNKFIVDNKTLSVFNENIIRSKFLITSRIDPCYLMKSKKTKSRLKI